MKQRSLGILLFPDFETLDVFGPLEMFGQLPDEIKIVLISEKVGPVKSIHGQHIITEFSCETAPHLDILLVPGGIGTRQEVTNQSLINWIRKRAEKAEFTLSVCTGAALLAKTGILNGLPATTNKLAFNWVIEQGIAVQWLRKARWVDAGKIITSAGVSAGMDMSLHVISRLFGERVRDKVAKQTEYIANTDPYQDPYA